MVKGWGILLSCVNVTWKNQVLAHILSSASYYPTVLDFELLISPLVYQYDKAYLDPIRMGTITC